MSNCSEKSVNSGKTWSNLEGFFIISVRDTPAPGKNEKYNNQKYVSMIMPVKEKNSSKWYITICNIKANVFSVNMWNFEKDILILLSILYYILGA